MLVALLSALVALGVSCIAKCFGCFGCYVALGELHWVLSCFG